MKWAASWRFWTDFLFRKIGLVRKYLRIVMASVSSSTAGTPREKLNEIPREEHPGRLLIIPVTRHSAADELHGIPQLDLKTFWHLLTTVPSALRRGQKHFGKCETVQLRQGGVEQTSADLMTTIFSEDAYSTQSILEPGPSKALRTDALVYSPVLTSQITSTACLK
jgi:hypothetical protein